MVNYNPKYTHIYGRHPSKATHTMLPQSRRHHGHHIYVQSAVCMLLAIAVMKVCHLNAPIGACFIRLKTPRIQYSQLPHIIHSMQMPVRRSAVMKGCANTLACTNYSHIKHIRTAMYFHSVRSMMLTDASWNSATEYVLHYGRYFVLKRERHYRHAHLYFVCRSALTPTQVVRHSFF